MFIGTQLIYSITSISEPIQEHILDEAAFFEDRDPDMLDFVGMYCGV